MNALHDHGDHAGGGFNWSRINQYLLWIGLAGAVGWLFFRHNEHLPQLLPFLLVLACPLMHLFGHHGHHGQRPSDSNSRETARKDD
jgi:Protein of unknown function (DUF2933).